MSPSMTTMTTTTTTTALANPGGAVSLASVHPVSLPSLDALLSDDNPHMEPWLPENFLSFLREEYNDENLLFFMEVKTLRAMAAEMNKQTPAAELLYIAPSERADKYTYLKAIITNFIKDGAPKQVNISHRQRTKILDTVGGGGGGDVDVERTSSFDESLSSLEEAQTEVKILLQHGSWTRFYQKTMTQNLSKAEARVRATRGVILTVLTLVGYALMMAFYVPRWYVLLLAIPLLYAAQELVQAKTRTCPTMANRGLFRRNKSEDVVVACPFVLASTRKRAKLVLIAGILVALLMVIVMVAITFIVDAASGATLYS